MKENRLFCFWKILFIIVLFATCIITFFIGKHYGSLGGNGILGGSNAQNFYRFILISILSLVTLIVFIIANGIIWWYRNNKL